MTPQARPSGTVPSQGLGRGAAVTAPYESLEVVAGRRHCLAAIAAARWAVDWLIGEILDRSQKGDKCYSHLGLGVDSN